MPACALGCPTDALHAPMASNRVLMTFALIQPGSSVTEVAAQLPKTALLGSHSIPGLPVRRNAQQMFCLHRQIVPCWHSSLSNLEVL